jgi:hypothetical protein
VSEDDPTEATTVARPWQVWAAENLLRGVPAATIVERLRDEGVPIAAAETLVAELSRSPLFEAARPLAREARRSALLDRLRRRLDRSAARPTEVPRRAGLSPADLRDQHFATNTPVIITDWVPRWRAFGLWTPCYLRERFGEVEVPVTLDRNADPHYDMRHEVHTRTLPLARFIEMIERAEGPTNDFYMVANNRVLDRTALCALLDDVDVPDELLDGKAEGTALWLGPAGTVTPLHHDTSNIVFCQIHGRKRYRLIAPYEAAPLAGAHAMYAGGDADAAAAAGALVKDVVLAPGEALFIPVGHWHEVRALDPSISIAFNTFRFPNDFDWYRPAQIR